MVALTPTFPGSRAEPTKLSNSPTELSLSGLGPHQVHTGLDWLRIALQGPQRGLNRSSSDLRFVPIPLPMARNRKSQSKAASSKADAIDIPEAEQWRIIQESGILKQIPKDSKAPKTEDGADGEEDDLSPFAEEVLNSMMLIIPMSFMLFLMDVCVVFCLVLACVFISERHRLVHFQYGRQPEYLSIFLDRIAPGVPSEWGFDLIGKKLTACQRQSYLSSYSTVSVFSLHAAMTYSMSHSKSS